MTTNIKLTKGYTTIVDNIDSDLAKYNWIAATHKRDISIVYAQNNIYFPDGIRRTIMLHRIILGRILGRELTTNERCDHIDGNGLNNLRSNLRLATICQNRKNSAKKDKSCSSHFKGVCWCKREKKWEASIQSDNVRYNLGYYQIEEDAAKVYDSSAKKLHGKFARLNFPEDH